MVMRKTPRHLAAIDNLNFEVRRGEILGLAGESGCGKTTTGKVILNLIKPTSGSVYFDGVNVLDLPEGAMKPYRRRMQMIYQDPYQSLPSTLRVKEIVAEPLRFHHLANRMEEVQIVDDMLRAVSLEPVKNFLNKNPRELSGGQRQRLAFARALVTKPDFIIADEPVSMLDASVRVGILNLMLELRAQYGYSAIFITHDFGTARYMCDRIAVMYMGRIVEIGKTEDIIQRPMHPYTRALLSVVPVPDPSAQRFKHAIKSSPPNPINLPSGCRFNPRCKYSDEICRRDEPELAEVGSEHFVSCHFARDIAEQDAK